MLRALAAFPLELPADERAAPFQPVAVEDIAATIAWLAAREPAAANAVTWDLMQEEPVTLGGVIDQFRRSFGTGEWPRITMPAFLLDLGAKLGDLANQLGWMPPMRTTAIAELRRGVTGDPARWMAATGIVPKTIAQMVGNARPPFRTNGSRGCSWSRRCDRKPRAVLDRVGLHCAGGFLCRCGGNPEQRTVFRRRSSRPSPSSPA